VGFVKGFQEKILGFRKRNFIFENCANCTNIGILLATASGEQIKKPRWERTPPEPGAYRI
jgi:hypothetical protein